jgi:hypothetical protein
MKQTLNRFILFFALLVMASATQAEQLQDFLKRTGTGNATPGDLHANFHCSAFVGGQSPEMNRDQLVKFWKDQKDSGVKVVVDKCEIVSKAETPNEDGKGAVISVVAKVSVTENVRSSILKIESITHFIVVRDGNGAFHLLYAAVPKQVRHA